MTQMNTDFHDDSTMKKILAFFASLREINEIFQWTRCMRFRETIQGFTYLLIKELEGSIYGWII